MVDPNATQSLGPDAPEQIGPYAIIGLLGTGGMGEVWLGQQLEPVPRRAAVKIVAHGAGKDVLHRFEEERRLLYVGMTRARERLFLSTCRRRRIAGRYQDQEPSPFLLEIPAEHLRTTDSPSLFQHPQAHGVYSFFGRQTPAPRTAPGERSVEPVADDTGGRTLRRGSRVRHPTLGAGVVLELDGEGDQMKIGVFFERAGKRKLIARYANLELL